jgi:hypothetical protein
MGRTDGDLVLALNVNAQPGAEDDEAEIKGNEGGEEGGK